MKTFLIRWYPSEGGYSLEQLRRGLPDPDFGTFIWPSQGLETARSGDNFYISYEETDSPVIVMQGYFLTDPDLKAGTIQLRPRFIADPTRAGDKLGGIRSPEWEGERVILLDEDDARHMKSDWEHFLSIYHDWGLFDDIRASCSQRPEANLDDAVEMVSEACCDETDPIDGRPAVLSALRVAVSFREDEQIISALLRDIPGKCGWTPGRLRERGFPEDIVDRLLLLQRQGGESPGDYLRRIARSKDSIALAIAAKDLKDKIERPGGTPDEYKGLDLKALCREAGFGL